MGRHKQKDVVDLMKQPEERRFRDGVGPPDEETCRFCESTVMDEGPWHEADCPKYTEFDDDVEEVLRSEEVIQEEDE